MGWVEGCELVKCKSSHASVASRLPTEDEEGVGSLRWGLVRAKQGAQDLRTRVGTLAITLSL